MSVPTTLPSTIIQMGHVEKLAEVAQNHPEVQQSVSQQISKEHLHRQKTLVPQVDGTEHGSRVRERDTARDKRQGRGGAHAKQNRQPDDAGGEADPVRGASDGDPWAGHILNIKI